MDRQTKACLWVIGGLCGAVIAIAQAETVAGRAQQQVTLPPLVLPQQTQQAAAEVAQTTLSVNAAPVRTKPELPPEVSSSALAFQGMAKDQFPLTPDQIRALRRVLEATQRASAAPARPLPLPTVSSRSVNLSPGTSPPVIRLATGYISSVVFIDENGDPWPIQSYNLGNPTAFNIQWNRKNNILMIQSLGPFQTGNAAIQLKGLPTPVMLTFVTDQKLVDYRLDLRMPGRGPNASAPLSKSGALPKAANKGVLLNVLQGIPPEGSIPLHIKGGEAKAWLNKGKLYLRTRLTLLSPSWHATLRSADGTRVYELLRSSPKLLASRAGKTVTLTVEGL